MDEPLFAPQTRVNAHPALQKDFIRRVLELPWAFVSDETSLADFGGVSSQATLVGRIRDIYGVEVSDIANGNLADIFNRIAARHPQIPVP